MEVEGMKMKLIITASLLALSALATVVLAGAQVDVVIPDFANIPILTPGEVIPIVTPAIPASIRAKYGLDPRADDGYEYPSSVDANDVYRRVYPNGQMRYEPTERPRDPLDPTRLGVERVHAFRSRWARVNEANHELPDEDIWSWPVPEALKKSWGCWGQQSTRDRYAALMLLPARWEDRNPALCVFDLRSGLRWQREVPLKEAVEQARALASTEKDPFALQQPAFHNTGYVGVSGDGSRILAVVCRRDYRLSLVFFYADSGDLLRILAFPYRSQYVESGGIGGVGRTGGGDRFILSFYHDRFHDPAATERKSDTECESYLVDPDGNVKCRFVDGDGKSVRAGVTRNERFAVRVPPHDGGRLVVYRLPPP
jgi:hypothetical protein